MKTLVFFCIGGNLGDRLSLLEEARDFIDFNMGDIQQVSSIYESEPWGMSDAPPFLNQVVIAQSSLSQIQLKRELDELDEYYGRERKPGKYSNREMDVDVLFYGDVQAEGPLLLPHPRLTERRFVLEPLHEIAPDWIHPSLQKTVAQLLKECTDTGKVYRFNS
jgi:2-amino-4-hydroxy-6-hydroxymethyldihydropteridine diphosphokinase